MFNHGKPVKRAVQAGTRKGRQPSDPFLAHSPQDWRLALPSVQRQQLLLPEGVLPLR